jgi:hypothetical protein
MVNIRPSRRVSGDGGDADELLKVFPDARQNPVDREAQIIRARLGRHGNTSLLRPLSPVRERAFGSLKYEHLYRTEIETLPDLTREAESYRQVFNHVRPHEALDFHRPIEIHRNPSLKPQPKIGNTQPSVKDS